MTDQPAKAIISTAPRETEFRRELRRAVRVMVEARWPVLAVIILLATAIAAAALILIVRRASRDVVGARRCRTRPGRDGPPDVCRGPSGGTLGIAALQQRGPTPVVAKR